MIDLAAETAATEEILRRWETDGIRFVRFEAPDIHGVAKSKLVPISHAARYATTGLNVYGGALVMDTRTDVVPASRYHEETSYADQLFRPDPSTAAVVPWADRTARLICHSTWEDGTLQPAAPRSVLRRVLDAYTIAGYEPLLGQEFEFYVLDPVSKQPAFFGGHHIFNQLHNEWHPLVREVLDHVPEMGCELITANCEYGPSQWEINGAPAVGMAAADAGYTFKNAVKELAHRHGLVATFMSKPAAGISGSGAHFHVSLRDPATKANLMGDDRAPHGLTPLAGSFIAGCLAYAAPSYALLAPTINCLKRRRPHTFSPSNISWGLEDRGALLRVKHGSASSRHVEHRAPSGLSAPHLVAAAVLAAGLLGIRDGLPLPEPATPGVPAEDDPRFDPLPSSLHESLAALEGCAPLRDLLGEEFVDIFCTVKRYELARFEDHVTDWELAEYAEVY
jgi:glutamine synthetase